MTEDVDERLDRIESHLEQQQELIKQQRARIADQQETIEAQRDRLAELAADARDRTAPVSRRDALKAGGLLAVLVGGVGTASANPNPQGQVGTSNNPLQVLYTEKLNGGITGGTELTDLVGDGLGLSDGSLTADLQQVGDGLALSDGSLTADLQQVGSGISVLAGLDTDGIKHRSLTGTDGVSVEETAGLISLGVAQTSMDITDTFEESDVTVNTDGTSYRGGEIGLLTGSTATRPEDQTSYTSATEKKGIKIVVKENSPCITATVSSNTTDETTVYLQDTDGNVLASTSSQGSGNSVILNHSVSAGQGYYVTADAGGGTYTRGKYSGPPDSDPDYPFTSTEVDITGGVDYEYGDYYVGPGRTAYNISAVSTTTNSGTATIEFENPTPVGQWTTAAYRAEPDGETVDVFVEMNGGNGWSTWDPDGDGAPEPIAPGTELSAIPPDNRVRFRVKLSRSEISNEPRLTRLSRQWRPTS